MFSSPLETILPTDSHLRRVEISYAVIANETDFLTTSPFSDIFYFIKTKISLIAQFIMPRLVTMRSFIKIRRKLIEFPIFTVTVCLT